MDLCGFQRTHTSDLPVIPIDRLLMPDLRITISHLIEGHLRRDAVELEFEVFDLDEQVVDEALRVGAVLGLANYLPRSPIEVNVADPGIDRPVFRYDMT